MKAAEAAHRCTAHLCATRISSEYALPSTGCRYLQDEIAEMKAAEAQREKLVADVVRENKSLAEPLSKVGGWIRLSGW